MTRAMRRRALLKLLVVLGAPLPGFALAAASKPDAQRAPTLGYMIEGHVPAAEIERLPPGRRP
jgi:hypothetical protein